VGENGRFFLLQGPQKKFAGRPLAGERSGFLLTLEEGRRPLGKEAALAGRCAPIAEFFII